MATVSRNRSTNRKGLEIEPTETTAGVTVGGQHMALGVDGPVLMLQVRKVAVLQEITAPVGRGSGQRSRTSAV